MLQSLSKVPAKTIHQQLENTLNQASKVLRQGAGALKYMNARTVIDRGIIR